jgi:DNA-directed RNA polymerase alpha subunit
MDMGLDALFVSRRAENCLRTAGCRTIADVARKSASSLRCTRGVGEGVLQEVRTAMGRLGLRLAGD